MGRTTTGDSSSVFLVINRFVNKVIDLRHVNLHVLRAAPDDRLLLGVRLRRPPRRVYISDLEEGLLTRALAQAKGGAQGGEGRPGRDESRPFT